MRKLPLILFFALSACTGYRQNFDCPPSCGVPCTSVSDIEAMIVETDEVPDVFLPKEKQKASYLNGNLKIDQNRIWVLKEGQDGQYIFFSEDLPCLSN